MEHVTFLLSFLPPSPSSTPSLPSVISMLRTRVRNYIRCPPLTYERYSTPQGNDAGLRAARYLIFPGGKVAGPFGYIYIHKRRQIIYSSGNGEHDKDNGRARNIILGRIFLLFFSLCHPVFPSVAILELAE